MRTWWAALVLLGSINLLLLGCSSSSAPINNPTPIIIAIFPDNLTAGSDLFTLNISGSGFVDKVSVATWNGDPRTTTLNAGTGQLAVSILASDVANPGNAQVSVLNPAPGGGTSSSLTFIVNPIQAGTPIIGPNMPFTPPNATAGQMGPFVVNVSGTNFASDAVVAWNGSPRPTTFISSTQLTVSLTTQDLALPGFGSVSVNNPGVGGGVSPVVDFSIN